MMPIPFLVLWSFVPSVLFRAVLVLVASPTVRLAIRVLHHLVWVIESAISVFFCLGAQVRALILLACMALVSKSVLMAPMGLVVVTLLLLTVEIQLGRKVPSWIAVLILVVFRMLLVARSVVV
jgi:hypothetical protein